VLPDHVAQHLSGRVATVLADNVFDLQWSQKCLISSPFSSVESNTSDVNLKGVPSQECSVLTLQFDPETTGPRIVLQTLESALASSTIPNSSQLNPPYSLDVIPARLAGSDNNSEPTLAELWFWRTVVSGVFFIPTILLVFILQHSGGAVSRSLHAEVCPGLNVVTLIAWLLATPVQFGVGWPLYQSAWRALYYGKNANIDLLVSILSFPCFCSAKFLNFQMFDETDVSGHVELINGLFLFRCTGDISRIWSSNSRSFFHIMKNCNRCDPLISVLFLMK
jgi:hypothetical protein